MVLNRCLFVALAVILVNCDPYVLPEDVEKCKLEDSVCMKKSVQKYVTAFVAGNPALGVEVMDVLNMDEVDFELSGLKFNLKEGKLRGLRNSVIDSVNWDSQKQRLTIDFHANTTVKGHYKADGRILILPITGDGIMKLKLKNIAVKLIMDYKLEKNADGKECAVPKKYDFEYEVKDNTHIDLTNLFNGNKELSDTTLTFMNENWKILSVEFGRPIMDGAARKIFNNAAKFLSQMPLEDISIV